MAFEKYTKNMTAIGTFEVTHGSHTIDCHGMLNVILKNKTSNSDNTFVIFDSECSNTFK